MSTTPDASEPGHLQHEAEHVRPARKSNVMSYLVVLFGAAFLLMLLTYFMQQRTNEQTIDSLKESSMTTITALKSLEELQADNATLQETVAQAERSIASLEDALTAAQEDVKRQQEETDALRAQTDALSALNLIRALYNQRKPSAAREAVAAADLILASYGGLEPVLTSISGAMTEESRATYDPLTAYQTIADWLE